jgi:hypothetical protein
MEPRAPQEPTLSAKGRKCMGRNHRITDWNPEDTAAWAAGNNRTARRNRHRHVGVLSISAVLQRRRSADPEELLAGVGAGGRHRAGNRLPSPDRFGPGVTTRRRR